MDVSYTADPIDLDQPAHEAAEARPGKPIRLRVIPTLLRATGDYVAWRGVAWTVSCQTAAEAIEVRRALEAFFERLGDSGPQPMIDLLTGS